MSTIKDITESKITIALKPKESVYQSLVKDSITFGFLLLCIYVSKGSAAWTLLCGIMFLMFFAVKASAFIKNNSTSFSSKQAAIDYINKQDIGE